MFPYLAEIVSDKILSRICAKANVTLHGEASGDDFGRSVSSAGDFNGDGKDDVIVGALEDDTNGRFTGSAYIFFGGATGTINAGSANVILRGETIENQFGEATSSAGDVNGDGKDDVIVGAKVNSNTNGIEAGRAYIFFGGRTGTINASTADVILNGENERDQFGQAVSSAGDFNGDGKDDVIVTAWANDNNGVNAGSAYIFFGNLTSGTTINAGSADVIIHGQNAGDLFGNAVSPAKDFNGDGKDDVIIANYKARQEAGSAFIFFGDQTGGTTINAGSADLILHGQSVPDQFGFSVSSAGDFNGDGKNDVVVGAKLDHNTAQLPVARSSFLASRVTNRQSLMPVRTKS